MKKIVTILVLIAILVSAIPTLAAGDTGPANNKKASNSVYIVQMAGAPVVAYTGDVAGFPATKPAPGKKVDQLDPKVIKYVGYLDSKHNQAMQSVGATKKLYSYRFSYNGFAAEMTGQQAEAMKTTAGVLAVSKDYMYEVDTASTPSFLGLTGAAGFWATKAKGEGVVIGIVDSGIWPENPSFSDRTGVNGNGTRGGKLGYQQIPGWNAKCVPGENFTATNCNQKLIGAQFFNESWGGSAALEAQRPWEFMSARDYNGHGSHTAGTAGGNQNTVTNGPAAGFGAVSGIAPRARISAYKALWSTQDASTASGFTGDLVAAIDQAVADGVDVINYSISGSRTNFLDPVMVSYLFAADAGIFVAVSAGNSGPTPATVAHPSPWVTTVAAGTHNRNGLGSVTLGNAVTYSGASVASPVGPAPFVDSITVGMTGAIPGQVALCYPGTLDPALVAGKIVLCDRGVIARVDKSLAVQMAGGVGMVLVNTSSSSMNADFHFVPTVHLSHLDRAAVKAYAATPGAMATINQSTLTYTDPAPFTASFSSRGPLQAGGGDLLKPDIIAPGQDILAAVAPPGNAGRDFNLYSGTSMSSPHIAGVAALFKELKPSWSPMMIKSAIMTSAGDILDGPNTHPLVIFRQGAGHVRPMNAADPGLVFNHSWNNWLAFLCGTNAGISAGTCTALAGASYSLDPSDLNGASIALGELAGTQTVTRKAMNVGSASATYTASVSGMTGVSVVVSPSSFTVAPGATQTFTVQFTTTTAVLNAYVGGQLTLADGTHSVRLPLVVKPVAMAAPAAVSGTGGPINYNVTFGYNGPFTADARGLIPAATTSGTVSDDPTDSTCDLTSPNAQLIPVAVPAGTTFARFQLFDADVAAGSDIDLCVFSGTTLVGTSGSGTSAEVVSLVNPAPGAYTVVVQGWGVVGSSPFVLNSWLLGSTAAGNMIVSAPATATIGANGAINLTFSGLLPATKYLGSVAYGGSVGMPNPTIVTVFTPDRKSVV